MMFLFTSLAWACTLTLDAPAAQSQTIGLPTFQWSTDCATSRLQLRAVDATQVLLSVDVGSAQTHTPDPVFWATLPEGKYRWRVTDTAGTFATQVFWLDRDDDGDGASVLRDGDCDDGDPDNFPGHLERCDGLDQDCDGVADNGAAGGWATSTSGTRDLTSQLLAGSFGTPAIVAVADEDVTLCPATYPARLVASGVVDVDGQGAALATGSGPAVEVLAGATFGSTDLDLLDGTGFGGGLLCTDGTVSLTGGRVAGHVTGSAISTLRCDLTLDGVTVEGNVSPQGGAGMRVDAGSVHLVDALIRDNVAAVYGAGVELVGSSGTCENSSILRNDAADGGGMYLIGSTAELLGCDMGVGADSNLPNDIYTYVPPYTSRHYMVGDDGNASCVATGVCGTSQVGTPSSATWTSTRNVTLRSVAGLRLEALSAFVRPINAASTCTASLELSHQGVLVAASPIVNVAFTGSTLLITDLDVAVGHTADVTYDIAYTCSFDGLEMLAGDVPDLFDAGSVVGSVLTTRI